MTEHFDYSAPAELFPAKASGFRRSLVSYKRFDTAAAALRYAMEELNPASLAGAVLEVEEDRFDDKEMKRLYASGEYPLPRAGRKPSQSPSLSRGENDN